MKKKSELYIRLSNVKTEEVTFKEPKQEFIDSFDDSHLNIGIGVQLSNDIDQEMITIGLHFFYEYNDEVNPENQLLNYKGAFDFKINNLKDNVQVTDGNIQIPDNILITLLTIAISSARGIIIAKTAGAFINKYYLPILNPEDILENIKTQVLSNQSSK